MSNNPIKIKILLIEDEPGFRRIYSFVLKNAGYEVLEAADGEKGIQMVLEHQPALVLLDLMLPKLNGFEVLEKIRETESVKDTPVIIFSVVGEQKDMERGMLLGANDYTIKGFCTQKDLLEKVQSTFVNAKTNKKLKSYSLFINSGQGDSMKLQQAFGLPTQFTCPLCQKPLVLEMEPLSKHTQTNGHWFASHFSCRICHQNF
jgi:DNA-binding response OmpR family regulator